MQQCWSSQQQQAPHRPKRQRCIAPLLLLLLLLATPSNGLERPNHRIFDGKDKCIKKLWPHVVDQCASTSGYHDSCQARVGKFQHLYRGSCQTYCDSFGFSCVYGSSITALSNGCGETTSQSYFACDARSEAEEAVCTCRDPTDTFLWVGVQKLCGAGRALVASRNNIVQVETVLPPEQEAQGSAPPDDVVARAPPRASCSEFCAMQGLSCTAAEEASTPGSCSPMPSVALTCDALLPNAGGICTCSGNFDRTGSYLWPEKVKTCATGSVLVSANTLKAKGGNCEDYCRSLRQHVPGFEHLLFSCTAGWRAPNGDCAAPPPNIANEDRDGCFEDFSTTTAVCSCSYLDL